MTQYVNTIPTTHFFYVEFKCFKHNYSQFLYMYIKNYQKFAKKIVFFFIGKKEYQILNTVFIFKISMFIRFCEELLYYLFTHYYTD